MRSLYDVINSSLEKENFANFCRYTQTELYNILINQLKMLGYKVYANELNGSCSRYIYAIGNIPVCLTAHLDTVFTQDRNKEIIIKGNKISSPEGLGADDRAGVYAILQIIKEYKCNVLFLEDEECGHSGAVHFIAGPYRDRFIKENNFVIDLDLGGSNILTFYKTENQEFQKDITSILKQYEVRDPNKGSSDLMELTIGWDAHDDRRRQHYDGTNVASFNIGVGYYKEHTLKEYQNFSQLLKSIKDVKQVIEKMPNRKYKAIL